MHQESCPTCREPGTLSNARLNRHLQRQVNSFKVYCKHRNEGCVWVGELRDLQNHLDPERRDCTYVAKITERAQQIAREYYEGGWYSLIINEILF